MTRLLLVLCLVLLPMSAQAKLILDSTSDTVAVVTASAVSTMHVHTSWVDITTSAFTPGSDSALITTATTTTVVGSPGASTQRQVKLITVYNAHASSSNAISIQHNDGTDTAVLIKYTLLAGETLQWSEDQNFSVIGADGRVKTGLAATFSSAFPSIGVPIGGTDGTNFAAPKVLTTAPSSGDPGMIVRSINPNLAADNSTNSSAKVPVLPCRGNASVPSWTEGNQVPCSTDLSGYQRATLRSSGATGAAPPDRANYVGGLGSGATGGFLTGVAVCDSFVNVNVNSATTTLLVTGVSGRHVRICGLSLVTAAANNVALISGTGATCGTGTTGMTGGTTAATGYNFAANGGIAQGSGIGAINQTNATGDSVCIVTSAAAQLSGRVSYAIY